MMIAKLRRTQFGRSSEQLDAMIDQLQLSLEELQVSQAEMTPPVEPAPRAVSRRKPLPEHLPRETHVHQPESQCTGCGGKLRYLGEDVSEVLEYVPARFKVICHVRPKWVCRCCEHIAQVPAPSRPIARGLAARGCWPMCWSPSLSIICRCTGSPRSTPVRAWSWSAQPWPTGWARAVNCSGR